MNDWLVKNWAIVAAVVGWSLTIILFVRQRRRKVKVWLTCEQSPDTGQSHVRYLTVNVVNEGTELNDMNVIVSFPQKSDGKIVRVPLSIYTTRDVPNPFKFGYSCTWHLPNNDPSRKVELFDGVPLDQIIFTINSRSLPVAVTSAAKWRQVIDQFTKADPTLPPKPPPPKPMENPLNYPKRW